VTVLHHPLTWAAPRPLWSAGGGNRGRAPTILRFASDEFMEQLIGLLDTDPNALADHVARFESWRSKQSELMATDHVARTPLPEPVRKAGLFTRLKLGKAVTARVVTTPADPPPVLKLYQPAHQRYYVVTATLACAVPGLPDRQLAGPNEQLCFVIRRVMDGHEHAYVKADKGWKWQRLAENDPRQLAPSEERLGVFPLKHQDGQGLRRSLWGGLVPVGKREDYLSAPLSSQPVSLLEGQLAQINVAAPEAVSNSKQARLAEFKMDFAEPWKAMVQSADKLAADINADPEATGGEKQKQIREKNWQYQMQSWLLLLDLMAFLERHLEPVHKAMKGQNPGTLNDAQQQLVTWFETTMPDATKTSMEQGFAGAGVQLAVKNRMSAAMKAAAVPATAALLESAQLVYRANPGEQASWPDFHYLLAGIGSNGNGAASCLGPFAAVPPQPPVSDEVSDAADPLDTLAGPVSGAASLIARIDDLIVLVGRALTNSGDENAREIPFAQRLSQTMRDTMTKDELFVIRFVHLNADCGPLHPPTVSDPTEQFRLASFFDSDAPARPIRITLPSDTSPAGLRKHAKGTAFVLSDILCGQVQRAKGLGFVDLVRQVLPFPLHKDIDIGDGAGCKSNDIDIGMICSISIPIITLCALILLMIIISLLDFIFRWIPWFITCFPVPGLKGKK
jgi:hypothetical protein